MLGHDAVYPATTPRKLSLSLVGHLLFAGRLLQYGFIPLAVGLALFYCALPTILTASALQGHLLTGQGTVTLSRDSGKTSGSTPIYENRYMFVAADGTRHSGVSYGRSLSVDPTQQVLVRYPENNPSISVISGMTATTLPPAAIYLSLVPFFAGLVLVLAGWVENFRIYRLLRRGQFGSAIMAEKEESSRKVNQHPVYDYAYEFAAPGGAIKLLRTSTFEWLDDSQQVLYLPGHETECVLTCAIPGNVAIGPLFATARSPLFQTMLVPMAAAVVALAITVAAQ